MTLETTPQTAMAEQVVWHRLNEQTRDDDDDAHEAGTAETGTYSPLVVLVRRSPEGEEDIDHTYVACKLKPNMSRPDAE